VDYSLSDLGISIRPILEAIYNWGTDYLKENGLEASCSMTFSS
jgi:DNA-binding HxlR family transcriptional regulator